MSATRSATRVTGAAVVALTAGSGSAPHVTLAVVHADAAALTDESRHGVIERVAAVAAEHDAPSVFVRKAIQEGPAVLLEVYDATGALARLAGDVAKACARPPVVPTKVLVTWRGDVGDHEALAGRAMQFDQLIVDFGDYRVEIPFRGGEGAADQSD